MRRLLIVSPHFPPSDAVDMHRARMNVAHYRENGWEPTVLCVRPKSAGRLVDDRLCATLPDGLDVRRVGALSERVTRRLGISALGIRAYWLLARAGDSLLKEKNFDLIFFSTTAFPVMTLGPRWRKRFAVPYVLDFQDPWYTTPPETPRRAGFKNRAMRALHRCMEAQAVPKASGLIAVSQDYISVLCAKYNELCSVPARTIPFGFAPKDHEIAKKFGTRWKLIDRSIERGRSVCICAGRAGDDLASSMRTLFQLVAHANECSARLLGNLDFFFLGTGYGISENPEMVMPIAREVGIEYCVSEKPDRLPLFDALNSLDAANILLVVGSDDLAYQPSKLYQYLHLEKPLLVVAPRAGRLAHQVRDIDGVMFLPTDEPVTDDSARSFARRINTLIETSNTVDYSARRSFVRHFEARELAKQECDLFDWAVDAYEG